MVFLVNFIRFFIYLPNTMKKQLLYQNLAKYYDLIYSWKDYQKEVEKIEKLISKYKKSKGKELLEVACGSGHHLKYFKRKFSCTGIDLNEGILDVAEKKLKNVTFKKVDMINFKLNKKFDIITCLFSSIGYVKTYENLRKTINNFARHLKTGGVVIIEPWFTKASFRPGRPILHTYSDDNIKVARMCLSEIRGNISILNMEYLVCERGKKIMHFNDQHELGLFEIDKTLQFMKEAGLKAKFLKNGLMKDRGLYIGVKE